MNGRAANSSAGSLGEAVHFVNATTIMTTKRMSSAGVRNLPSFSMIVFGFHDSASAMPKKMMLKIAEATIPSTPNSGVIAVSMDTAPVRGSA